MSGTKGKGRKVWVIVAVVVAVLVLLPVAHFAYLSATATRPTNLGVQADGKLQTCPNKPNCVSTLATDKEHGIEPFPFTGDPKHAWAKLKSVVESMPRTIVVKDDGRYMHVEFRSFLFRFPDDVEFLLDGEEKRIDFRSASRAGYSDLGVNRARMEEIRKRWSSARHGEDQAEGASAR